MNAHITANTKLFLTPRRAALLAGFDNLIEVLVRIQAPDAAFGEAKRRPPYGIALVIDRSGSMSGRPLYEAKRCADFVVDRLRADDVVSLVSFDSRVTLLRPALAKGNGDALKAAIQSVDRGGCTNLHGGWREGADNIAGFDSGSLRRVILLSDGCANEGIVDTSQIADQCGEMAGRGVTTSTYGLGNDFNEELMVAMADTGQGNHYYGDTAEDLMEPFQQEFDLLANLAIRSLSLRVVVPAGGQIEMLNDYVGGTADGWHLPDLAWDAEAWAVLRFRVPKERVPPEGQEISVLRVELMGRSLDGESVRFEPTNLTLRAVGSAALTMVAEDELVARRLAELDAAKHLREAREAARRNDWPRVDLILANAEQQFAENEWLASVLEAIRAVARSRSRERFMKEALYSSATFSKRLSMKNEVMSLMESDKPSYLRRKVAQGKAEFDSESGANSMTKRVRHNMSAFAKAMFDQLRHPDRDVRFHMRGAGEFEVDCPCRDFLYLRAEEQSLIRDCLRGRQEPRVLDIGCGIGRHSEFAYSLSPHARISVVEIDQQLRDHCVSNIPGAIGYEQFSDVLDNANFDVAFLMGNGLGIFGSELETRRQLQRLRGLIAHGGSVLIESGNFAAGSFYVAQHEIEYDGSADGPFAWGYATSEWLQRELVSMGFEIVSVTPSSRGGPFFICHAKRSV